MATTFSKEQREFIVKCLASVWSYKKIGAAFAGRWPDTTIGEQDVKNHDRREGALLPPDLHMLWDSTRAARLADPNAAPFADPRERQIALSDWAEFLLTRERFDEARSVLRQLAEETGAVGPGGKGAGSGPVGEPVTAITRIIVDPVTDAT